MLTIAITFVVVARRDARRVLGCSSLRPEAAEARRCCASACAGARRGQGARASPLLKADRATERDSGRSIGCCSASGQVDRRRSQQLIEHAGTEDDRRRRCSCAVRLRGLVHGFALVALTDAPALARAAARPPRRLRADCLCAVRRARKRLLLFEEQFPEAIDLIARALRAGHAFTTGLSMVGRRGARSRSAREFRQLYDEQNFGKPLPEAMRDVRASACRCSTRGSSRPRC